jgi:hypothetical protein
MVAGPGKNALTMTAALSMLLVAAGAGLSQTASPTLGLQEQPPVAPQQGQPPSAPPASEESGLINEMGKLFGKLPSLLPSLKSPGEAIDDLNARAKDAAKDAGDAVSRLAKPSSMIAGRMACPTVNGTPDCKAGADRLCRSKGYKEGSSLGTDAIQSCSPKAYIPGRPRMSDDCRTDNYVTAALCQ